MTIQAANRDSNSRIDVAGFFHRLGLSVADERPIMQAWRQANADWRRQRREQIALHAQRVAVEIRKHEASATSSQERRIQPGRPRAVWCVELQRQFSSLTEAAAFVGRKPSNISQSLSRGVKCGSYHWEAYEPGRHNLNGSPTV